MSSMISPIAPRGQYRHPPPPPSSTPAGDLQNLRLASCSSLFNASTHHNTGPHILPPCSSVSTANLLAPNDSPKSSRGILSRMRHHQSTSMMPPPSMPVFPSNGTPKRGMASMAVASSPNGDQIDGYMPRNSLSSGDKQSTDSSGGNGFTLPKTPTLMNKVSRRPSFKFKSSAFIGGSKNK